MVLVQSGFVGKKLAEGVGVEYGSPSQSLTGVMATVAFSVLGYSGGGFRRNSTYAGVVDIGFWILALVITIIANLVF